MTVTYQKFLPVELMVTTISKNVFLYVLNIKGKKDHVMGFVDSDKKNMPPSSGDGLETICPTNAK